MTLQALTLQPFWRQDCCAKCLAGACGPVLNLGLMFLPQSVGAKSVCVKVLPSGLTEEIATIFFYL